jgi:hypothetical protein
VNPENNENSEDPLHPCNDPLHPLFALKAGTMVPADGDDEGVVIGFDKAAAFSEEDIITLRKNAMPATIADFEDWLEEFLGPLAGDHNTAETSGYLQPVALNTPLRENERDKATYRLHTAFSTFTLTAIEFAEPATETTADGITGYLAAKESTSYLGATAFSRLIRPGEDHVRGNDLPDGPLSFETWQRIKDAIILYELVPSEVDPNADVAALGAEHADRSGEASGPDGLMETTGEADPEKLRAQYEAAGLTPYTATREQLDDLATRAANGDEAAQQFFLRHRRDAATGGE